jgi:hypothetical protein
LPLQCFVPNTERIIPLGACLVGIRQLRQSSGKRGQKAIVTCTCRAGKQHLSSGRCKNATKRPSPFRFCYAANNGEYQYLACSTEREAHSVGPCHSISEAAYQRGGMHYELAPAITRCVGATTLMVGAKTNFDHAIIISRLLVSRVL